MPKPSPIVRYRIRNWRAYNRALINRGRLTVWFDEYASSAANATTIDGHIDHLATDL